MDILPRGISVTGFVYLIKCNEFVKIGVAVNAQLRIRDMQIGNPYELVLLKSYPSPVPYEDEENLHCILERYRVRGEWFKLPQDIVDMLLCLEHLGDVDQKDFPTVGGP